MNYILRDLSSNQKFKNIIKNNKRPLSISGLICVAKSEIVSLFKSLNTKPVLVVTYNELEAERLINDLSYFNDEVLYFPKKEISVYDYDVESSDIDYLRMEVLNKIHYKKAKIVVATIEAIMQDIIKEEDLYVNSFNVKSTDTINVEELKEKLVLLGYERTDLIEGKGQFSVRGDIIDISLTNTDGIRIELWGDDVDSIRKFKISTQRSTETIKEIEINPTTEKILALPRSVIATNIENLKNSDVLEDVEIIREGNYASKIDKYFNEFYPKHSNLLEYCSDYQIFIDESAKVEQRIKGIKEDNKNLLTELVERGKRPPEILENLVNYKYNVKDAINLTEEDILKEKETNFDFREVNLYKGEEKTFETTLNNYVKEKKKIIILAGSSEAQERLKKQIPNSLKLNNLDDIIVKPGQIMIAPGNLSSGFEDKETGLIVFSSSDFFENKKARKRRKSQNDDFNNAEKIVFADLREGDLVVHVNYGIGRFLGVETITNDGITKDYIKLQYKNNDTLYIPTENLDNVRKYIGGDDNAKLNRLGGKEWQETKNRVKGNLRTVAKELIELYAVRENVKGFAFSKDTPWQREFESSFAYQETDDQLRCIEEVKKDMEMPRPMDRLLCGDVGYGKTEVAIRAAFKAVMDSKQVAYLTPTTILANQQYLEFKERMKEYPVRIELLNRFKTQKEQKAIVEKLRRGEVDIVIGTHRLLSQDVVFNDLGLLIIDEEHRFGVKAKEKIKQYKSTVDVLTMTATPIPRTLQMSIVGIRDMSVIYEPPQDRKPVQTYVLEYDREIVREAITKELERGGQVFYLYNYVDSIESKVQEIERLVPEASVAFAHGQMSGEQIEQIMQDFIDKKTNVLVCTTILESGIDISNANTIIVENADRFGLAQLYQIRGRVGRSKRQAYAYITYRRDKMISEDATERLKAIKEFTEFGSGFKIATRDLQIRGAGSLFGEVQHGHMEQVGYDMYNRLLGEVIKEIKGEKIIEEHDITIDVSMSSYIPDFYINNTNQKIEIYQDIADCKTEEDVQNVKEEIIDRYGNMPDEVNNLLEIARIKNLCRNTEITKIQQKPMGVMFTFTNLTDKQIGLILENYRNQVNFSSSGRPYITLRIKENTIEEIKDFIKLLSNKEEEVKDVNNK